MHPDYSIRFCTIQDAEVAARLITTVFLEHTEFGDWTRMLMDGTHPTARPEDTIVVVEKATDRLVSAIPCAPQTYTYAGLPLPVMNMQIVGTLPEHREKGLLRAQVDAIVSNAQAQGFQAVTVFGIAGFYPKLGFLPLLPVGGGRVYSTAHLRRKFPAPEQEMAFLRPVQRADLPFLAQLHANSARRYLVTFPYDVPTWKLAAFDYFEASRDQVRLVTDVNGLPLGSVTYSSNGGADLTAFNFELMPGVNYLHVLPAVIRALLDAGESMTLAADPPSTLQSLYLAIGPNHPVDAFLEDIPYRTIPPTLGYLKICDLPGFINHIKPVLEERIAQSSLAGYTREVKIELYYRKEGLVLKFENGRLTDIRSQEIEGYQLVCDRADIEMPVGDWIRLMFGQVSVDELTRGFREVNTWNGEEGLGVEFRILLHTLFPKKESQIYPPL